MYIGLVFSRLNAISMKLNKKYGMVENNSFLLNLVEFIILTLSNIKFPLSTGY